MSQRRYRFLTNPRIFSFFTEPCINRVQFFLTFIIVLPTFSIGMSFLHRANERDVHEKLMQDLADARAEIRALKAAATQRNGTRLSSPASIKGSADMDTQTPAVHAPDHSDVFIPADTVEVKPSGILKGLPLDVAKEIQEEYRVASMERATRYHEWNMRRRDHHKRDMALVEKELAHGDALLSDSKERREHLLAVYASMSPEQLEAARKEALKTQPVEVVDLFFTHVSEYSTSKSPGELKQESQDLQKNQEILAIAWRKLEAERKEIQREQEELERTEPPPPNLGLDEFYTEWKKRNRTKLTK